MKLEKNVSTYCDILSLDKYLLITRVILHYWDTLKSKFTNLFAQ